MNTALNRSTIVFLTNKSGGALDYGDVVVLDNTNDNGFTTTTSAALSTRGIGVILDVAGIANNATGAVVMGGWCPQINLDGAATVGQFINTDTVAGQGTPHASPQVEGDFAVALEASATPSCWLFGSPNPPSGGGTVPIASGGTGQTTATAAFDALAPTTTQGDLIYHNGTDNVRLPKGTASQVLTMNAGATAPEWAAGGGGSGLVLLSAQTASASASLDFTSLITSTYDEYVIEFVNVVPASNSDLKILLSTDNGGSWDTTNVYRWQNGTTFSTGQSQNSGGVATAWLLRGSNTTLTSGAAYNGSIRLYGPLSASLNKTFSGQVLIDDNSLGLVIFQWAGTWRTATAVNAFQVSFASGNITSGAVRLYGLAK